LTSLQSTAHEAPPTTSDLKGIASKGLDVDLLRHLNRIIDLDAEVVHRAADLSARR